MPQLGRAASGRRCSRHDGPASRCFAIRARRPCLWRGRCRIQVRGGERRSKPQKHLILLKRSYTTADAEEGASEREGSAALRSSLWGSPLLATLFSLSSALPSSKLFLPSSARSPLLAVLFTPSLALLLTAFSPSHHALPSSLRSPLLAAPLPHRRALPSSHCRTPPPSLPITLPSSLCSSLLAALSGLSPPRRALPSSPRSPLLAALSPEK